MSYTLTITGAGEANRSVWPESDALLQHLYRQIGCQLVTAVQISHRLTLWCDDEALLAKTPRINEQATKLLGLFGELSSYVVGTVVLTGPADHDGRGLPLSGEAIDVLGSVLGKLASRPLPRLQARGVNWP